MMTVIDAEFQRVFALLKIGWLPFFGDDAKKIYDGSGDLPIIIQSTFSSFNLLPTGFVEEYHEFYIFNNYDKSAIDHLSEIKPKYQELMLLILGIINNFSVYRISIKEGDYPTRLRDTTDWCDIGYKFTLTVTYNPLCE